MNDDAMLPLLGVTLLTCAKEIRRNGRDENIQRLFGLSLLISC
jgi:hypothetical protein